MRAFALVATLIAFPSSAQAQDWASLAPIDADSFTEFDSFNADEPDGYRNAVGDFDGDGQPDSAAFYGQGDQVVLALRLAVSPDRPVVIWNAPLEHAAAFGVATLAPGVHRTACRRYWHCEEGQRSEVDLRHDGILLLAFEGPAQFLYFWNGGTFENELLTE